MRCLDDADAASSWRVCDPSERVRQIRYSCEVHRAQRLRLLTAPTQSVVRNKHARWILDLLYTHVLTVAGDYLLTIATTVGHPLLFGSFGDPNRLVNSFVELQGRVQEV